MEQTEVGKIPSSVQDVPGRLQAARERMNEQARYVASYADEAVHNNPWTSIGIGFGVGVVIGALIAIAASSRSLRL